MYRVLVVTLHFSVVVNFHAVDPYSSTDSTIARKKFLLSEGYMLDFQIDVSLFSDPHALSIRNETSLSVDIISLPRMLEFIPNELFKYGKNLNHD